MDKFLCKVHFAYKLCFDAIIHANESTEIKQCYHIFICPFYWNFIHFIEMCVYAQCKCDAQYDLMIVCFTFCKYFVVFIDKNSIEHKLTQSRRINCRHFHSWWWMLRVIKHRYESCNSKTDFFAEEKEQCVDYNEKLVESTYKTVLYGQKCKRKRKFVCAWANHR